MFQLGLIFIKVQKSINIKDQLLNFKDQYKQELTKMLIGDLCLVNDQVISNKNYKILENGW